MVNKRFRKRIQFLPYLVPLFLTSIVMFALDLEEVAPLSLVGSLLPFGLCVYYNLIPCKKMEIFRETFSNRTEVVPERTQFSLAKIKLQDSVIPEDDEHDTRDWKEDSESYKFSIPAWVEILEESSPHGTAVVC